MSGRDDLQAALEETADKHALRRLLRSRRDALSEPERNRADAAIAKALFALPQWERSTWIYTYCSVGSEVDTTRIIERALAEGRCVALPRVVAHTRVLAWHEIRSTTGLILSRWKIPEPDPALCPEVDGAGCKTSLALVPGLAFDEGGMRIGYGGGYYDTFLARFQGSAAGLCRVSSLVHALPHTEAHDRAVEVVVTG